MMAEAILTGAMGAGAQETRARERRSLSRAMVLSALGHATVIALAIGLWHPEALPVPAPPIPVKVVIETGRSGASGGGSDTAMAGGGAAASNGAEASASALPSAAEPPTPEHLAPILPPAATPAPPQPAPPPMPAPSAVPLPTRPVTTASREPVPPHKPAPPAPREEVQPLPPSAMPVAALPQPQQAAPATTPALARSGDATAASKEDQDGAASGGRGRGDEGAGLAGAGHGGLDKPGDDYLDLVRRWIARFRDYPDEAVKKREEGTVAIGFKFARDGQVLDAWIEKSSGFPLLDDAALKMIRDASPIPKVPDRYKGETLTLVMPENYHIGIFDRIFH